VKSAGEPGSIVPPNSANRACILGSARPALISLFNVSMIEAGVFLNAPTPHQKLASKPGRKSAMTGRSDSAGERVAVVTANARNDPAFIYIDQDKGSNLTWTCPANKIDESGCPAPIRHMEHIYSGHQLEKLAGDVIGTPNPGRRKLGDPSAFGMMVRRAGRAR
jgi:hypothetical protein